LRGSDVIILIALVVLFALMVLSIVMIWYNIVEEAKHLYVVGEGQADEMYLLLLWTSIVVYIVSYLVPKKIIFKENISELFIAFIIFLVVIGVSYIITVMFKILFVGPGSKPVQNIEIIMSMLFGLMGVFLALVEHREDKKEYEHKVMRTII
jgi:glucan phosphoethanolaminetransferase (alkaline phosphatase superfamily)